MADNPSPHTSDEIDLGQLFQMIGKGFQKLFKTLLRAFLYLRKNVLILGGLVIVGFALGYGLNQITSKRLKTEIIVKPNMDSKNYLYNVIDEIQANIRAGNLTFFNDMGINLEELSGFEVTIAPVDNVTKKDSNDKMKYLELLQNFEKTSGISDIVRTELENKTPLK